MIICACGIFPNRAIYGKVLFAHIAFIIVAFNCVLDFSTHTAIFTDNIGSNHIIRKINLY